MTLIVDLHSTGEPAAVKKTIEGRAPVTLVEDRIFFTSRSGKDILVHQNSEDVQFKQITEAKVRKYCCCNDFPQLIY